MVTLSALNVVFLARNLWQSEYCSVVLEIKTIKCVRLLDILKCEVVCGELLVSLSLIKLVPAVPL